MMQTKLAAVMDLGKVSLGDHIDRLEARGFVSRQPDPLDKRAKRVVLTARGAALLAELRAIGTVVNAERLTGISGTDIACTDEVLHRMKQNLIAMGALPGASATTVKGSGVMLT
jgi:DNA-binding MarR family transcriptional regulator